jgi:hypothetical protein
VVFEPGSFVLEADAMTIMPRPPGKKESFYSFKAATLHTRRYVCTYPGGIQSHDHYVVSFNLSIPTKNVQTIHSYQNCQD